MEKRRELDRPFLNSIESVRAELDYWASMLQAAEPASPLWNRIEARLKQLERLEARFNETTHDRLMRWLKNNAVVAWLMIIVTCFAAVHEFLPAFSPTFIKVTVKSKADGTGIAGADVILNELKAGNHTDETGLAEFSVPHGDLPLQVTVAAEKGALYEPATKTFETHEETIEPRIESISDDGYGHPIEFSFLRQVPRPLKWEISLEPSGLLRALRLKAEKENLPGA